MGTQEKIQKKCLIMMTRKLALVAIAGIGAALGLGLIIIASLVVSDEIILKSDICYTYSTTSTGILIIDESCRFQTFWKTSAALGIIAGILQYLATGAVYFGKPKIWSGVNMFVAILCAVAFDLALDKGAFNPGLAGYSYKFLAFAIFSLIDLIFAISGAVGVFAIDK